MKRFILINLLIVLLSSSVILSQVEDEEKSKESSTKIETFLSQKNIMIIKDSYKLGELNVKGRITFSALVIYQPGKENNRIKGIMVVADEFSTVKKKSNVSYLDMDELENFSKAVSYMIELSGKWENVDREPYTVVKYTTEGNFKLGFYQDGDDRMVFATCGTVFPASVFLQIEDLTQINSFIENGISILNQK